MTFFFSSCYFFVCESQMFSLKYIVLFTGPRDALRLLRPQQSKIVFLYARFLSAVLCTEFCVA